MRYGTDIDFSKLPAPNLIKELDYELLLTDYKSEFLALYPSFDAWIESEPAIKLMQLFAARDLKLRHEINDSARARLLAYAEGADLDHLAANEKLTRLIVDPGNPDAIPPVPPVYEFDDALRRRVQLSPEGYTTAGSYESYQFHALSADGQIKDVQAHGPEERPGEVDVFILTHSGTASETILDKVAAALNAMTVRPLTDKVNVMSATLISFDLYAELVVYAGPDPEVVRQTAEAGLLTYMARMAKLGFDITLSGVLGALHVEGVQRVKLLDESPDEEPPAESLVPTVDSEGRLVVCGIGEAASLRDYRIVIATEPDA